MQSGNNLRSIAKKLFGAGGKRAQIAELNHLTDTIIHTGDVLKISEA